MSKLILHICLICGCAQMVSVDEYHKTLDNDKVGGVMYGCTKCDYVFSIDGRIDLDDPDLFDEETIKKWEDKDWKKVIVEYFEKNPEDKKMLDYQKAVTASASKMYNFVKNWIPKEKKE